MVVLISQVNKAKSKTIDPKKCCLLVVFISAPDASLFNSLKPTQAASLNNAKPLLKQFRERKRAVACSCSHISCLHLSSIFGSDMVTNL